MDLSNPSSLFLRPGMAEVLRVLAGTTSPLTGRTVARLAGLSTAGAAKVLVTLVRHGVVDSQHAGSANLYRLNRGHLLVAPLLVLLSTSERLEAGIAAELRSWTVPCAGAVLFGSAARRDGGIGSDVDILLIRPEGVEVADEVWRDQCEGTAAKVHEWTGNPCAWMEFSTGEFADLMAGADPFVGELRLDGRWVITPPPALRRMAQLREIPE